jgi:ACS family hexuronate transporter-like MFS transporter
VQAKAAGMGEYVEKIKSLNLVTKYGDKINLDTAELGGLSKDVTAQLQSIDPAMYDKLLHLQKPLVQGEMTTAYTIMFAFCALAYLIAWTVMKTLVPKYKPITDL